MGCVRAVTAALYRCLLPRGWRRWCSRSPSPAITWCAWVPGTSRHGRLHCRWNSPSCSNAVPRGARRDTMMTASRMPDSLDTLPVLRGRVQANAPLAPFTWFRVGGPAEALVRPADEADLAQFLHALPPDIPVHTIGACSNLIIRDGGLPGVVVRLARGFG